MFHINPIRLWCRIAARGWYVPLLAGVLCVMSGCTQDMANQPKQLPLTASTFFPNGAAARQLVPGTVPRGSLNESYLNVSPDDTKFPIPVTAQLLDRGRQRFNIYCSVCHGYTGYGDGMIVRRGFPKPPSYHTARLRQAPVGHFYDVITHGFNIMPSYAEQVPPRDRWAIIAYIRALQLSQYAPVSQLPPQDRARLQSAPQSGAGSGGH